MRERLRRVRTYMAGCLYICSSWCFPSELQPQRSSPALSYTPKTVNAPSVTRHNNNNNTQVSVCAGLMHTKSKSQRNELFQFIHVYFRDKVDPFCSRVCSLFARACCNCVNVMWEFTPYVWMQCSTFMYKRQVSAVSQDCVHIMNWTFCKLNTRCC